MRQFSKMTRLVSASLLSVSAVLFLAAPVYADKPADESNSIHKSYVCKYVGKPGVDERLQTGQNPIWVDNHSLTGKDNSDVNVGDTFSDAQGKSVVIVANTAKLNPEPSIDACPAAEGPTTPTIPETPPVGRGGEVLGDSTIVTPAVAHAELANTGVSTLTTTLLSLLILALTAGVVSYRSKQTTV
jgi:hypothetical protein